MRSPGEQSAFRQTFILVLWIFLICCVVVGELLPGASPVMVAIGRLHIWDKLQHFGAYLALSSLPVIGFRDKRRGIVVGLSMFLLGVLLELGQHSTTSPYLAPRPRRLATASWLARCGTFLFRMTTKDNSLGPQW